MNRRGTWVLVAVMLVALAVYLFTREGALAKGSALWAVGFSFFALRKARSPRTGLDASQRAVFKELLRLTIIVSALGLFFLGWAVFSDPDAGGLAILCLGLAALLSIPTVTAYRNRESTQPWGVNGA